MINKKKLVPKKRARKDRAAKPISKKKAQKRSTAKRALTRSQKAIGKSIVNTLDEMELDRQKRLQRQAEKEVSDRASSLKKVRSYKKNGHTCIKHSGRYYEGTIHSKGTIPGSPVGD